MEPIIKYDAWELCAEILKENRTRWHTLDGMRCWLCWMASKPTPANRLVSQLPGYRGCPQVNRRYNAPAHESVAERQSGV